MFTFENCKQTAEIVNKQLKITSLKSPLWQKSRDFPMFLLENLKNKQTAELFTFENCKQTAENVNKKK